MRVVRALGLGLLLVGCGGGEGGPVESSQDPRHNVMVIDDGFDLSVPVFSGRVAAAYSIVCPQPSALEQQEGDASVPQPIEPDGGAPDGGTGPTLADRKAGLIASLRLRDTSCHLEPGLEPKPDPLASIARFKDRWNQAIRNSRYASDVFSPAEREQIEKAFDDLDNARFHGTATAGLVAHNNSGVRLVLVEERLGSAAMAEAGFTCIKQQDIDDNVTLFSDPEVAQAYVDRPFSQLDDDFREVATRHRVGVVNESFGTFSRQRLEELQTSKGCGPVDLRRYFSVIGQLDAARVAAHPEADVLVVKSAGNDHSQLDGAADHPMCNMPANPRLVVGAYDHLGNATDFTNFGGCVDVVGPGYRIIAPIPGNWYLPLSGTSFSAPLTARLISVNPEPVPFGTGKARELVLAMRDSSHRIPLFRYPRELLYDPDKQSLHWALRVKEPEPVQPLPINVRKLREFQNLLRLGRAPGAR